MKKMGRKISLVSAIVLMIGAAFCAGLYMNSQRVTANDFPANLFNKESELTAKYDFGTFWKVWELTQRHISYGTASSTPDQEKIYGAIKGLVASLDDPYSEFMPPERSEQFEEELSGSLEGIGVVVGIRENALTAISPLKDSPADKAGVRAGDIIFKIDGVESVSLSVTEAVKKIKGPKGTKVVLTLIREGKKEPVEVSIVRDVIKVPTLETSVLPGGVFVIKLYEFNAVSTNLFAEAMKEFYQKDYKKLVLDLRNNPGGYLGAAVDMASYFLPSGKVIVTEDYGLKKQPLIHRSKGLGLFDKKKKMAVLVNGGSASASEILAGALQDYGIATLVGEKSFGKGSVQELIPITDDTSLKLTIARWTTPNGHQINHEGLTPTFVIKITEEDFEKGKDPQMDKAVQFLKEK
jgi:carboxyl-terminal processing protease